MSFSATLDGSPVEVEVLEDRLRAKTANGDRDITYVDMDEVHVDGWSVTLRGPGTEVTLAKLGSGRDKFLEELRAARLPARRAAMLQAGENKEIDTYDAKRGDEPVVVGLHADGITVTSDAGTAEYVPLSCITDVRRDNYDIAIHWRGGEPVAIRHLGPRTDEFLQDLQTTRAELDARTRAAYAALDPSLAILGAPDGWALEREQAGPHWDALRNAFAGQDRSAEIASLESIAGDELRLGIKSTFAGGSMPFALAPSNGRVAVESADDEARATFVFETTDVDQLNVVLLVTSFRREALYVDEANLGRWAVAVRMLPIVRWARGALRARVVHNEAWDENVRKALAS